MPTEPVVTASVARFNDVALHGPEERLAAEELRQRACTELLRQAAQADGLLDASDTSSADGIVSEAAVDAIDTLLERKLSVPEPSEQACRRHYDADAARAGTPACVHCAAGGRMGKQLPGSAGARSADSGDTWRR